MEPESEARAVRVGRLTVDGQHELWRSLWTYCTSLFGRNDSVAYRGSGTFISCGGVPCLLTAAHVWEHLSRDAMVGFTTEPEHPPIWVARGRLQERVVSRRLSDEWGPDIAIVSLNDEDVGSLQAEKAFYRIERKRPLPDDPRANILWAITGASAELSQFTESEARLKNHTLAVSAPAFVAHDGLDYFELPYGNTPVEDIPVIWGGLSGAALWLCHLVPGATETELEIIPFLSGVAFYQRPIETRIGVIRCHGPGSLRSQGLDHVAEQGDEADEA
jgi:hypothetical protein